MHEARLTAVRNTRLDEQHLKQKMKADVVRIWARDSVFKASERSVGPGHRLTFQSDGLGC
jgi:hypothetical protein